jgi:hypothetical protein
MHQVNDIVTHLVAFFLGIGCIVGALFVAANTVTINELRANNISINTEEVIGENPEVSLEDMTVMGAIVEYQNLSKLGDEVDINMMVGRYDLILPETLDKLLTPRSREIPIRILLAPGGVEMMAKEIYMGNVETYDCLGEDGEPAHPTDPDSYWYDSQNDKVITGLDDIVADLSLYDILTGQVTSNNLLDDIKIADILGYTLGEDGYYYDGEERATGVMALFADCDIFEISDKIKEKEIGHLLGYKYDEVTEHWIDEKGYPVHSFMNAVSSRNINDLHTLEGDLTIGDIIPEEKRSGVISLIPADTHFDEINEAVNDAVKYTPLQFFINEGLVAFDQENKLDILSTAGSLITTYEVKNEGEDGYIQFMEAKKYYEKIWTEKKDSSGNVIGYTVPTWRTKPLSQSFDYIVGIIAS